MTQPNLERIQASVLDRMENAERLMKVAMIGAATIEALLLAIALYLIDWNDRLQILLFVFSILGYTIIVLGMVALGGHVTRSVGRVLAAMDTHS